MHGISHKIKCMAEDLCTLRDRRATLADLVYSGVQSTSVDGQSATFQSLDDMRAALADLDNQIARLEGRTQKRPRAAQVYLAGF